MSKKAEPKKPEAKKAESEKKPKAKEGGDKEKAKQKVEGSKPTNFRFVPQPMHFMNSARRLGFVGRR